MDDFIHTEEKYPIGDCTTCGEKDTPFNGFTGQVDEEYKLFHYCLKCQYVSWNLIPKRYISREELEELELGSEL